MAQFDRSNTTFYWSAIVNIALSGTVFIYLMLSDIMTLKSGLNRTQGHSNWYHSKCLGVVSYSLSIVNCVFFIAPLQSMPPLGGSRQNIDVPFGTGKLEWWGYPMVKKL